jgi:hypothetical protein
MFSVLIFANYINMNIQFRSCTYTSFTRLDQLTTAVGEAAHNRR